MKLLKTILDFLFEDTEEILLKKQILDLKRSFPGVEFYDSQLRKRDIRDVKKTLEKERKARRILLQDFSNLYLSLISIEDIDLRDLKYLSWEFKSLSLDICEIFIEDIRDKEEYKNRSSSQLAYRDNYLINELRNLYDKFEESYPEVMEEKFNKFITKITEWHDNREKRKAIRREEKRKWRKERKEDS